MQEVIDGEGNLKETGMTTEELDAALDACGLTPAQRIGVEAVAAMKAHLYGREHLDLYRKIEALACLQKIDPEAEEDVLRGDVSRERVDAILERERNALLDQAEYVGAALLRAFGATAASRGNAKAG